MAEKRIDRGGRLGKARWTAQGYARVDAHIARVGIQTYRNADGTTRRELRHPDDVFAANVLEQVAHAPVTIGHPGVFLDTTNTHLHRVGHAIAPGRPEGNRVATAVQLEHADALAEIAAGNLEEISAGYTVDLDETPGVWEGQRYDARQTNITLNHIALLPRGGGRAGPEVRLRLDSGDAVLCGMPVIRLDNKDFEVAPEVLAHVATLGAKLADSEKALGSAETKLVAAESARADALDPKALDARVAERVALETSARKVLGEKYSASGKTARAVHEDVLKSVRGDSADFAGLSDERVLGQFEALTSDAAQAASSASAQFAGARKLDAAKDPNSRDDAQDPDALDPDAEYKASIARKAGKK